MSMLWSPNPPPKSRSSKTRSGLSFKPLITHRDIGDVFAWAAEGVLKGDAHYVVDGIDDEAPPPPVEACVCDSECESESTSAVASRGRSGKEKEKPVSLIKVGGRKHYRSPTRTEHQELERQRAHKRKKKMDNIATHGYPVTDASRNRVVDASVEINCSETDSANFPAARGAYTTKPMLTKKAAAKLEDKRDRPEYAWTASELVRDRGFEWVRWNGATPRPVLDVHRRVIAVLAGRPDDADDWDEKVVREAGEIIEKERLANATSFTDGQQHHRRGDYVALHHGISLGPGAFRPYFYDNEDQAPMMERIIKSRPFVRLAGYASKSFSIWAPKVYSHYVKTTSAMYKHRPDLAHNRIHPTSVFPCCTLNFGPCTRCFKHRDNRNLAFGWCAITALGKFNHKRGGQLVLWDLKLVIDFPPGSTVLIPSAAVAHSNTPIGREESRYSYTQYCSGDIFRWVENGFRIDEVFKKREPAKFKKQEEKRLKEQRGIPDRYYSVLESLIV